MNTKPTLTTTQIVAGTVLSSTNADANVGVGSPPPKALIAGLIYNTIAPAPSTGQTVALQGDKSGNLKVNVSNLTAGIMTASPIGTELGVVTRNIPSGTQNVNLTNLAANLLAANPVGTELGVVTRNIPSGIQTVSPAGAQGAILNSTPTGTEYGVVTRNIPSASITGGLLSNGTLAIPQYKTFGVGALGNNTLVNAVPGKIIRILSFFAVTTAALNIYFTSNNGGTIICGDITYKINLLSNATFLLPFNSQGWFQNDLVNQAIVVNLSAAGGIAGCLTYVLV